MDPLKSNGKTPIRAVLNLFSTFGLWQGQAKALVNMMDSDEGLTCKIDGEIADEEYAMWH